MNPPTFKHSRWKIRVIADKQIVLIKGRGAWSKNTAERYSKAFREETEGQFNQPWICVGYGAEWEAGVPEIEPILQDLYQWMVSQGCVKQITMINQVVPKAQVERMMSVDDDQFSIHLVSEFEQIQDHLQYLQWPDIADEWAEFIESGY